MRDPGNLPQLLARDLAGVTWLAPDEIRARARRRTVRKVAAAPVVLLMVMTSLWLLAGPGRDRGLVGDPVGDGGAPLGPSAAAVPGWFGPEDLAQPDDVGAGYTLENEHAFAPGEYPAWTFSLEHCDAYPPLNVTAFRSYTWMRINIVALKGDDTGTTDVHTELTRYPVPIADQVMTDVRRVVQTCGDFGYASGEASTEERPARTRHTYTIESQDFAGDDSLLIRQVTESRDARTGELLPGDESLLVTILTVVRVEDRVEVLQTYLNDADRMRKIATKAARRL
ncbi:hypothetical protein I0C86_42680 [Plantactinospora sp. S1510]|uniref:Uncharacterized protein n=1 Tax=Plantactinospora alkalitolerans TaxID=2789879 RepID=A0ABS0HBN3_9ACTN|nr:hypothetical protein [Plantactinospora alkalitolerans]MBF9135549.1 hypothetical protein [Plantactinospora alkalitolerans]